MGFLGSKITSYFESKGKKIGLLELKLGHNLSDEKFVKEWFSKNKSENLINCFAMNDHVIESKKSNSFLSIQLTDLNDYYKINAISLFSVCREFIRNQVKGKIINLSSIYSLVSP